jgi:lysophospholipase L1-like esterase
LNSELHALRRAAQESVLGASCPEGTRALAYGNVPAEPWTPYDEPAPLARFVAVENEAALAHFHRALARLAAKKDPDGKVRILAYGASHTQADIYPSYLRSYLQSRFGNGGQGFVLLGRVNRWHRVPHTRVRHKSLTVDHARYRKDARNTPLGLFGAALVGRSGGSFGEVAISKSSPNTKFQVHYFKQPGGGDFNLILDRKTIVRIETKAEVASPSYHAFETAPGAHTIRAQLRGNGPVRLFGVVAETAQPGVVVDTLGIGGSDIVSQLRWHEEVWKATVQERNPDLVTFAYGTNETMNRGRSVLAYEAELRAVLSRFRRALPVTSCLLLAPFDVPNAWRRRLVQIVDAQRRVSKEFGCAFWDGYAFMGGEGSMRRWVRAKPPLAAHDYIHLTALGYVYAGIGIGDALMRAYDAAPLSWALPPTRATPARAGQLSAYER